METEAVCELLGGKGKVLVLMGPALRTKPRSCAPSDIEDVIAKEPRKGMEIVDKQVGNWNRTQGADLTTNWLTSGVEFDAIISNNDEMAIGAIQALKQAGVPMDKVVVAGIDATPTGWPRWRRAIWTHDRVPERHQAGRGGAGNRGWPWPKGEKAEANICAL